MKIASVVLKIYQEESHHTLISWKRGNMNTKKVIPEQPLTKKRFEALLMKAAQTLPEKRLVPKEIGTSNHHSLDDCSDKCKNQDKIGGKEG